MKRFGYALPFRERFWSLCGLLPEIKDAFKFELYILIACISIPRLVLCNNIELEINYACWRHHMETFSALLAICAGNSPVTGEFPLQRPVTWSFNVFFDLRLNKRPSKQSWGWWFETPSRSLLRHCNVAHYDFLTWELFCAILAFVWVIDVSLEDFPHEETMMRSLVLSLLLTWKNC